jgi:hypothetical protein
MFDDDDDDSLEDTLDGDGALELELWACARLRESTLKYLRLGQLLDIYTKETGAPRPSAARALYTLEDLFTISYDTRGPRIHARLSTGE